MRPLDKNSSRSEIHGSFLHRASIKIYLRVRIADSTHAQCWKILLSVANSHQNAILVSIVSCQEKWLVFSKIFSRVWKSRSSHQRCSKEKSVLKNLTKFIGKHRCQSLFFNEVAGLRPATLLKKKLWHRCFPANFVKFLVIPFLQNNSGWLLLKIYMKFHEIRFYAYSYEFYAVVNFASDVSCKWQNVQNLVKQ